MKGSDESRYLIPAAQSRAELVVDRSRFVCTLAHAPTTDAAKSILASIRTAWPDATHHCTAWIAGPPGSGTHIGMSDDGEPHGTAGRPMFNVLLHSDIGEIVAVVTRWYGGVKLGTGGLARAYSGTVELALVGLVTVERIEWVGLDVVASYSHVSAIRRLLPSHEAELVTESFDAAARFRVRVPRERAEGMMIAIADATSGQAVSTKIQIR